MGSHNNLPPALQNLLRNPAVRGENGRFQARSAQSAQERREERRHRTLLETIKDGATVAVESAKQTGQNLPGGAAATAVGGVYGSAANELMQAVSWVKLDRFKRKPKPATSTTEATATVRNPSPASDSEERRPRGRLRNSSNPLAGLQGRARAIRRREIQADNASIRATRELQNLNESTEEATQADRTQHREIIDRLKGIIKAIRSLKPFGGMPRLGGLGGGRGGNNRNGGDCCDDDIDLDRRKRRRKRGRNASRGSNGGYDGGNDRDRDRTRRNRGDRNNRNDEDEQRRRDDTQRRWDERRARRNGGNPPLPPVPPPVPPLPPGGGRRGGMFRGMRGAGALAAVAGLFGLASIETDDTLTREEKNRAHGENVGVVANGAAGAAAGAAIGTMIFPGVGTVVGGLIGGFAADYFAGDAASELGSKIADWIDDAPLSELPGRMLGKVSEWTDELKASAVGQSVIAKMGEWTQTLKDTEIGKHITEGWDTLTADISTKWDTFSKTLTDTWENLKKGTEKTLEGVNGWIKDKTGIDVGATVGAAASAVGDAASSAWDGTKDMARGARDTLAEMTGQKQNTVAGLLHWGESKQRGYNDYNRGGAGAASNKENIDLTNMTIGEIMEKQRLPVGHKDRIFAAGKYQIIGSNDPKNDTMGAAVKALGLDTNAKFDEAMQERIFTEYLAKEKRKPIENFITGKSDDVKAAGLSVAQEWASVGTSAKGGKGYYDGDGSNHASIKAEEMEAALIEARAKYQKLISSGMDEKKAYGIALGAYQESGAVAAPPVGMIASAASAGMGMYDLAKTGYDKGKAWADGAISNTAKGLRVKASDGSTKTLDQLGISSHADLQSKGGQAFQGGYNDPTTLFATSLIQNGMGENFDRVTAQNDAYHNAKSPGSDHTKGTKTDFTVKGMTGKEADQKTAEIMAKWGLQKGIDFETINEYDKPSAKATGGHIDFKLKEAGQAKIAQIMAMEKATTAKPVAAATTKTNTGYYDYGQPTTASTTAVARQESAIPAIAPVKTPVPLPQTAMQPPAKATPTHPLEQFKQGGQQSPVIDTASITKAITAGFAGIKPQQSGLEQSKGGFASHIPVDIDDAYWLRATNGSFT